MTLLGNEDTAKVVIGFQKTTLMTSFVFYELKFRQAHFSVRRFYGFH